MSARLRLSLLASLALIACENKLPSAPVVSISPTSPRTDAELKASVVSPSTDLDEDPINYRFQWTRNGAVEADLTTDTVPAARTKKGETWGVVVTPNDGAADGDPGQAQAIVENTPPVATATIEPASPTVKTALKAVATGTDADEDTITYTYAWTRDGRTTDFANDEIPVAQLKRGEKWEVTVTPNDGEVAGQPVKASTTIGNTPPVLASVTLTPESPTKLTPILAQLGAVTDADGDSVTTRLEWRVNGELVAGESGTRLPVTAFARGQSVELTATPFDAVVDGSPIKASVTIGNALPTRPVVEITPATAAAGTELTCSLKTPSTDADGDAISYVFKWKRDGVDVAGITGPVPTESKLAGAEVPAGATITCTAVPADTLLGEGPESSPASLKATGCGDALVQAGEQCDDGNKTENDTCRNNCTWYAVCGDNNVQRGEECDDGNTTDADGCTADCKWENCARNIPVIGVASEAVYPALTSVWVDDVALERTANAASLIENGGFTDATDDLLASGGWTLETTANAGKNWGSCRYDANAPGATGTALACLYGLAANGDVNTVRLRQTTAATFSAGDALEARYCLRGTAPGQTAHVTFVNASGTIIGLDRTVTLSVSSLTCESQSFTASEGGPGTLVIGLSDALGATQVIDFGTDLDDGQASLTLPFAFRIPGGAASQTSWKIGTNGMIAASGNADTYTNQLFPSTSTPNGVLAPFWDDLKLTALPTTGTAEPTSMVHWKVEGASPSRTFAAEWIGTAYTSFTSTGVLPRFQLRITEAGEVSYHYDAMPATPPSGSFSGTIGLEDETGTVGVTTSCGKTCALTDLPASSRVTIGRPALCGTACTTASDCNPAGSTVALFCSAPAGQSKTCR